MEAQAWLYLAAAAAGAVAIILVTGLWQAVKPAKNSARLHRRLDEPYQTSSPPSDPRDGAK